MITEQDKFIARLDAVKTEQDRLIELLNDYLEPIGNGKVRRLFDIPGHPELMAVFVTDNWSARDFVFGFVIPGKGKRLNIATIAMKRVLRNKGFKVDLVAYARHIDEYLPAALRGKRKLWEQMTIVRKCDMILIELVLRNNLLGSALKEYRDPANNQVIFGQELSEGLEQFSELSPPFQSPTTKAKTGHDLPLTKQEVDAAYPGLLDFAVQLLETINGVLAEDGHGRCLDIKFEIGRDFATGDFVLCDEISPDSTRLCRLADYQALLPGGTLDFLDKEFGRAWADKLGIQDLDPASEDDRAVVRSWRPDEEFVIELLRRYDEAFFIWSRGHTLDEYVNSAMTMN